MEKKELLKEIEKNLKGKISYRGGSLYIYKDLLEKLTGLQYNTPECIGWYCNYLGGGIRGSLIQTETNRETRKKQIHYLNIVFNYIKKRYMEIEDETGLNNKNNIDHIRVDIPMYDYGFY